LIGCRAGFHKVSQRIGEAVGVCFYWVYILPQQSRFGFMVDDGLKSRKPKRVLNKHINAAATAPTPNQVPNGQRVTIFLGREFAKDLKDYSVILDKHFLLT
jgi:hypothetical protein